MGDGGLSSRASIILEERCNAIFTDTVDKIVSAVTSLVRAAQD